MATMENRLVRFFFGGFLLIGLFSLTACKSDPPIPKPVGYFRIDIPEADYQAKDFDCPFTFEISKESRLEFYKDSERACWFNISYPNLDAKLHITYKPVEDNMRALLEEAHGLAYEHQIKANKISSELINISDKEVYGLVYNLGGEVASPYQFYLTDSTTHFLRGSLYFNSRPNPDSLLPSLTYIRNDMRHFIGSFEWDNQD